MSAPDAGPARYASAAAVRGCRPVDDAVGSGVRVDDRDTLPASALAAAAGALSLHTVSPRGIDTRWKGNVSTCAAMAPRGGAPCSTARRTPAPPCAAFTISMR